MTIVLPKYMFYLTLQNSKVSSKIKISIDTWKECATVSNAEITFFSQAKCYVVDLWSINAVLPLIITQHRLSIVFSRPQDWGLSDLLGLNLF